MRLRRGILGMGGKIFLVTHLCESHGSWSVLLTAQYSTVPAGQKISFKGTDLLTIDLASRKVKSVTTSSDLLNYYRALGYPLGVESAPAPAPASAPNATTSGCWKANGCT